jgi:hypothetical protein
MALLIIGWFIGILMALWLPRKHSKRRGEACHSCRYLHFGKNECHRRAPVVVAQPERILSLWPSVTPFHDWCGDYQEKPPDAPAS